MSTDASAAFWLFHLPQFVLAALMYTLLGRFLMSLFYKPDSDKVLWRTFQSITQPFIASTKAITPKAVPDNVIVLFAFVWALFARIGLFVAFWQSGFAPAAGA
ncbi:MAG: hypothetical protein SGJ17_08660 [Hyphomicrobiales bacterium]|nr:hypothetical protein [Hyphomicrobiales bacterium]